MKTKLNLLFNCAIKSGLLLIWINSFFNCYSPMKKYSIFSSNTFKIIEFYTSYWNCKAVSTFSLLHSTIFSLDSNISKTNLSISVPLDNSLRPGLCKVLLCLDLIVSRNSVQTAYILVSTYLLRWITFDWSDSSTSEKPSMANSLAFAIVFSILSSSIFLNSSNYSGLRSSFSNWILDSRSLIPQTVNETQKAMISKRSHYAYIDEDN